MTQLVRTFQTLGRRYWKMGAIFLLLALSAFFGMRASLIWLVLLVGGAAGVVLVLEPRLGLFALIVAALLVPLQIGTGTAVTLNAVTLFIPVLFGLWLLVGLRTRKLNWTASRVNRPLSFFLLAGMLSLLLGNALWDPAVPKSSSFLLVQLAQWGIFALSAMVFWLMANWIQDKVALRRLVFFYLAVAGSLGMLYVIPQVGLYVNNFTSGALGRSPFWMLLTCIAGGQLAFNRSLSSGWKLFLVGVVMASLFYAFYWERETVSTWGAIVAVIGLLAWLRFPSLRWLAILVVTITIVTGLFSSVVYEFAGGDEEWTESGGSRLTLIARVVEVTMRNPITGLGPASYRPYAGARPLQYGQALWQTPLINSHNNYVDLFAHVGLLGMGIFFWFAVELGLLAQRLSTRYRDGVIGGFVNGMFAAWIGSLLLMMLADWILPFVYNVGFTGFQASVLIWLFLGGLVAVDQWELTNAKSQEH